MHKKILLLSASLFYGAFFIFSIHPALAGPSCLLDGGGVGSCTDSNLIQCTSNTVSRTPLTPCPNQGFCCVSEDISNSNPDTSPSPSTAATCLTTDQQTGTCTAGVSPPLMAPACPSDTWESTSLISRCANGGRCCINGMSNKTCTSTDGRTGTCTSSGTSLTCPEGQEPAITSDTSCPHCCVTKKESDGTECRDKNGTCVSNSLSGGSNCGQLVPVSEFSCGSYSTCCMTIANRDKVFPPGTDTNSQLPETDFQKCKNKCYASGQIANPNISLSDCVQNCQKKYPTAAINNTTPYTGYSGGIVPCGSGNNKSGACTLCDLIVGFKKIISWGSGVLIALSLFGIFVSGVLYIVSSGSEQLTGQAKKFLAASLTGFAIFLMAWLIVNVVMWILAFNVSSIGITGGDSWYKFTCTNTYPTSATPADQTGQKISNPVDYNGD